MADAMTLAKTPKEPIKAFNRRLRSACSDEGNPVTSVDITVVDGEPVVTLFSEMVEATEEDVADAKTAGEELKIDELIPDGDPVVAQVVMLSCATEEAATKTQEYTEKVYERADGGVRDIKYATGSRFGFVDDPNDREKEKERRRQVYIQEQCQFMLVSYLADFDESDDKPGDEQAMEAGLRAPANGR